MDDRRDDDPLDLGPLPPPPEPPPLPEQPLGPPSMADDVPPPGMPGAGHLPPPPAPFPGHTPPPQPQPAYAPAPQQPLPYQPPPPAQTGARGQPVFRGRECASWGSRAGAWLLDVLFAAVIPGLVSIGLLASGVEALEIVGGILLGTTVLILFPLYSALLEARGGERNGQTWGKQMAGVRVVRDKGEPVGIGFSLLREVAVRAGLFWAVGSCFFFVPFLLDLLWPIWDESNRSLHDMIVGSHVVFADDAAAGGSVPGTAGLPG